MKTQDTGPEMIVRRLLHQAGYRYRLHPRHLPGKPDIAFPGRKKAIFVHGCFWHGHGCRIGRPPKSRPEYWLPKLAKNQERDAAKQSQLEDMGWSVFVIWQCETTALDILGSRLSQFLEE